MNICQNCGNQIWEGSRFCTHCGAPIQVEGSSATVNSENIVYQNMNNMAYPNQGYENVGYQNSNYDNNQYQAPYYGNNMYQNMNYYQQPANGGEKPKKPVSKKKIAIIATLCLVALLLLGAYFIFFGGKLTKSEANKVITDYMEAIEDKDLMQVIENTIPMNLVKDVVDELDIDDMDYDEVMDELEDGIHDIEDELDEIEISFSDISIDKVSKFDFDSYVARLEKTMMDYMGDDYSVENVLDDMSGGEMSLGELEKEFEGLLEEYDIDIDDIYVVELSFSMEIETKSYGDYEFDSEDFDINYAIIYKYDDQWYMIPAMEGAIFPSLVRYTEKSKQAADISSCKTIKTAVETALGNESIYEFLTTGTEEYCYIYIEPDKATEGSDSPLTVEGYSTETINGKSSEELLEITQMEIGTNIGQKTPKLKYTANKPTEYVAVITKKGTVYVFISVTDPGAMTVDEDEYEGLSAGSEGYQICPEISYEYR